MGSGCTQSYTDLPSSSETVAGTQIPEWVAAAGRGLFAEAANIAQRDYDIFPGEGNRIADLTDAERQGMSILSQGAENYLPYMNRASEVAGTLGGGYQGMSSSELLGDPYSGASRGYLEGDFQGLSSDQLMGDYRGSSRADLLGSYDGASREDLLGSYQGASREDLIGQGVDPFSMDNAQQYMDIYQSSMDPAVREIEQQTMQAQNQARASAARSGAFGGSRLGIMEGTAAGEGAQAAGDLRAQAAREGLGFAAGRYDQDVAQSERDRAARFGAENTMRNRFTQDQESRFGAEDVMRNRFTQDQDSRFGAEDVMRGQFMEDRSGRFSAEDARRAQAESDRSARFSAENTMYGRYGDEQAARFDADTAGRSTYETNEASRIQQMQAYQGMAPLVQDLQRQAAAGLIGAGEAERMLDQQALDLAYADFLDQRDYDKQQVNFALGALSGTPYNTINRSYTTGTNMTANPSLFGQALGGMGSLYSAYKMAGN